MYDVDYMQLAIAISGFVISLVVYGVSFAFAYGVFHGRVKALEDWKQERVADDTEIFNRLRTLEDLSIRFEASADRFERILSNGVVDQMTARITALELSFTNQIAELNRRLSVLEQHCRDMHKERAKA